MGASETACPRCGAAVPSDARFCPSCGYATTRLVKGQTLDGKYEILEKIAEGGMGEVYRARHLHLDEIRIIKVTKPDPLGEGPEPRRFQEEARIATLVRHPNVAALYDFSRLPDGSYYMVWEFIDGVTLEEWLKRRGPLPVPRAVEVADQVLSGLAEIHAQGIVHRDLSPDNIMLRELAGGRLRAKIIDLGIAKRVAADSLQMTGTGMFLGKLKYCSPEQAGSLPRGQTVDGRSDLYSFGVVLYEMLTGRAPFEAQTPEGYLGQHLHTPPPPLDTAKLPARVGPALRDILKRALEKNRGRRFRDANEFRAALAGLERAGSGPIETAPTTVLRRERRGARAVWSAGAALLVLAAVAAYALIHRPRPSPAAAAALATPPPATLLVSTPEPTAPPDEADVSAPRVVEGAPETRGSGRTVENPSEPGASSEVGVARERHARREPPRAAFSPAPSPAAAAPAPSLTAPPGGAGEAEPGPPERMDAEAPQKLRRFLRHWATLPLDRQARRAPDLARWSSAFVQAYPNDPLSEELRRDLPGELESLARRSLDDRRPFIATLFYRAYRALSFAPVDPDLERRFAELARRFRKKE